MGHTLPLLKALNTESIQGWKMANMMGRRKVGGQIRLKERARKRGMKCSR